MKRLSLFTKPIKLLMMLTAFTVFCAAPRAEAQAISTYSFTQGMGTYSEISGGDFLSGADDDDSEYGVDIGFTFKYNGTDYTTAAIWTNGFLVFGNTGQMNGYPNYQAAFNVATDVIAPLAGDLYASSSGGELRTEVTGTSPNRVFTVQWKNYDYWLSSYTENPDYNFQIKLYETSNKIEIVYGSFTMQSGEDQTAGSNPAWNHVGIRSSSTIRSRNIKNGVNTWATSTESSTAIANDLLTTIYPPDGLTYTWTPPPPDNGALTGFTSPVMPFSPGSQNVIVTLKNSGSNNITSATIDWTANGVSQSAYTYSGSLAPGATTNVTLGSLTFADGVNYVINANITSTNNTTDTDLADNSVSTTVSSALNGTYTVGGTNPTFATISAAAQAITNGGVLGAVTINIRPGTYTEQFRIGNYPNASTSRPVVFQSENGNPASVRVQYAATTPTADNYVAQLDGADNVTIKNMTLVNTGASYGTVVFIQNGADNAVIQGNILTGRAAASSAFEDAVVRTPQGGTANNNNLSVLNNTISNGSLGFYAFSPYVPLTTGLRIDGNTIQNAYAGPILMDYMNSPVITNNTLIGSPTGRLIPGGYGIRIRTTDGNTIIERNKIRGFIGGRGIVVEGSYTSGDAGRSRIANNFIEVGANTGNDADGINVLRNNVDVFNNTVNVTSTGTTADALDIGSFTSVDVRNNILIAKSGRALNATGDFGTATYNNLYTTGPVLVSYAGTTYATLADWQTATGKGANSVSLMPAFASSTDLHLTSVNTQLFGTFGPTSTDIDNETRRMYYMGADEVIPVITINTQPLASSQGCFGSTTVLSVNASSTFGSAKTYQWQKNGSPIFDNGNISGTTTPTLTIANTQLTDAGIYAVRITDNSGATPVVSSTSNLIVFAPIVMVQQPKSAIVCPGSEAVLSFIANGTVNGIQWQKENPNSPTGYSNIPGATTPQIFFNNASFAVSGKYRALLFGTCGTDTLISNVSTLFVGMPTYIARQVENELTTLGGTATLSVEADVAGNPATPASYQWYRNGIALNDDTRINGSKSSVLTINNINSTDTAATYYASVTGLCGTAQSNVAKIGIAGITIAEDGAPKPVSVCAGDNAAMTVSASGTIPGSTLSYQWMKDGVALNNVPGKISGVRTATLTITGVTALDESLSYTVKITSQPGGASYTSPAVALSLKAATAITTAPVAQDICEGTALDLSVTAAGAGLSYEWRLNGTPISGATGSTYSVPVATPAMAGDYTVFIKGDCGETTSPVAAVTVKALPTVTTQPVASVSMNQFTTLTLTVAAAGQGPLTYQWYKDGVLIAGATSSTFTKNGTTPADAGTYHAIITGECGTVQSENSVVEITTGVADIPQAGYSVAATSPSPVVETGRISFTLGKSEMTTITITDMFGREVAVIANGFTAQGTHQVTFSTSELKLTSGVYMYTVQTPTFRATRQMVVVK